MIINNNEQVGRALRLLGQGLRPVVEREMRAVHGERWLEMVRQSLPEGQGRARRREDTPAWDIQNLLGVMWNQWNLVFRNMLGQAERNLVNELREVRNRWAHPEVSKEEFSTADTYRALDSMQRLLAAISAKEAGEVEQLKQETLEILYKEQACGEAKRSSTGAVKGQIAREPTSSPRTVLPLHPDVTPEDYRQMVKKIYDLIRRLPHCDHRTSLRNLPQDGIYVFFERGEAVPWNDTTIDRIVRVGTHRENGNCRNRIRQHFGGNKNGSVFRKHLGGALLRKANLQDSRLQEWLKQGGRSFPEVEEMVSRVLQENLTFSYFRADQKEERLVLEKRLVALLVQYPLGQPSADWLGRYAASEEIRSSGVWNTQHLHAEPLTDQEFRRVEQLVKATLAEMM